MKKFSLVLLIGSVFLLSACGGGDSDSSGGSDFFNQSQRDFYEARLSHLPTCKVDSVNKIIYAGQNYGTQSNQSSRLSQLVPQECKVKIDGLNDGLSISLKCSQYGGTRVAYSAEKKYMSQVSDMLSTGKPYTVSCEQ